MLVPTPVQATRVPTGAPVSPTHPQQESDSAPAMTDARRIAPPTGRDTASSERTPDLAEPARASTGTAALTRSRSTQPPTALLLRPDSAPRCGVADRPLLSSAPLPCRLASTRLAASSGATPTPRTARDHMRERLPLVSLSTAVSQFRSRVDVLARQALPTVSTRERSKFFDVRSIEPRTYLAPRTLTHTPRRGLEHVPSIALPLQQLAIVLVAGGETPSAVFPSGFFQFLERKSTTGSIPIRTDGTPVSSEDRAGPCSPRVPLGAPPLQRSVVVLVVVRRTSPTPCASQSHHRRETGPSHPSASRTPSSRSSDHLGWSCFPTVPINALPAMRNPKAQISDLKAAASAITRYLLQAADRHARSPHAAIVAGSPQAFCDPTGWLTWVQEIDAGRSSYTAPGHRRPRGAPSRALEFSES